MDRRTLLTTGSTCLGWAALARHGLAALSPPRLETLQHAVDEAARGDIPFLVAFIEDNRRLTGNSPLSVRLAALELLEGPDARAFREAFIGAHERGEAPLSPPTGPPLRAATCRARQAAAGVLLEESTDEDVAWLSTRFGGDAALEATIAFVAATVLIAQLERAREIRRRKIG